MKAKQFFMTGIVSVITMILGSAVGVFAQCDQNTVAGNCVLYARQEVPTLPYGLTYYSSKLNIINHRFPRVGSVAVMPVSGANSAYGHVAVVRNVAVNANGSLKVTIQESNFEGCYISSRTINPESINIQGYFDPSYPSGQPSPQISSVSNSSGYAGQQFYVSVSGANFDSGSVQGIIMGGWCDYFEKCTVPNNVLQNKTSSGAQVPVTLGSPGTYTLYMYNPASGKTSNGKSITIY